MTIHVPEISVVLPVYNAQAYVAEAVNSILSQSFSNFELIIINDGSTDASSSILRKLASLDSRIKLFERPNCGLVFTLNEGISQAKGWLIARMDADDISMPDRFSLQYARMVKSPDLAVIGSFIRVIDKNGNTVRDCDYPLSPAQTSRFLECGSPVAHPAVMMRRDAVLKVGGYRKVFSHCEDYDLWLRINEIGYNIANIAKPLLRYRVHGANVSAVHRAAQELGTIVARLAHRARMAGLPDPTVGVEEITPDLIESLPLELKCDVDAAFFVLRYSDLSLKGRYELETAWCDFQRLQPRVQKDSLMCGFLMRLLNGAVRGRMFALALRVLLEALRQHSSATLSLLSQKIWSRVASIA